MRTGCCRAAVKEEKYCLNVFNHVYYDRTPYQAFPAILLFMFYLNPYVRTCWDLPHSFLFFVFCLFSFFFFCKLIQAPSPFTPNILIPFAASFLLFIHPFIPSFTLTLSFLCECVCVCECDRERECVCVIIHLCAVLRRPFSLLLLGPSGYLHTFLNFFRRCHFQCDPYSWKIKH